MHPSVLLPPVPSRTPTSLRPQVAAVCQNVAAWMRTRHMGEPTTKGRPVASWPLAASSHSESVLVLPGLKPGRACHAGAGPQGSRPEGEVWEEPAWPGGRGLGRKPARRSLTRRSGRFLRHHPACLPRGQCRQISFLKREGAWSGITSYARRTGAWPRGQRAARSTATEG